MIFHQTTPWKHTIAIRIAFDLSNSDIHKNHEGLIHVAEHLLFVKTKKYTPDDLYEKKMIIFDALDASTSANSLIIDAVCHKKNLKQVCHMLHDMIYFWQSNKSQFENEKKYILNEWKEFENEPRRQAVKKILPFLRAPDASAIGSKKRLESLQYSDIDEIKKTWHTMLKEAPQCAIVASAHLSQTEKKWIKNLLHLKKSKKAPAEQKMACATRFFSLSDVSALLFETVSSSPFFIILQRLYYVRWARLRPAWHIYFTREKNYIIYTAYQLSASTHDQKKSR